jgi:putative membrane protein
MLVRITLAVLHLLALGIGLGAIFARARALHQLAHHQQLPVATPSAMAPPLSRVLTADAWWGLAALLWVSTGLWRAIGGTEKGSAYYWHNTVFQAKMGLFAAVFLLELWPMVTLTRWRGAVRRHDRTSGAPSPTPPTLPALAARARAFARISDVQTLLIVGIVVAAVLMARGYGARL